MKYNAFIDCEGSLALQLGFLSTATEKNGYLPHHEDIYIIPSESGEEGDLCGVATDGKRLHIVDPLDKSVGVFGLTPGYWKVFKKTKKPIVWAARIVDTSADNRKFPDYKKVMPNGEPVYKTSFQGFCHNGVARWHNYGQLAKFLHDFPDTTAINLDFLHALGMGFTWEVEWYGPARPLKFTESNRTAIIMPMHL